MHHAEPFLEENEPEQHAPERLAEDGDADDGRTDAGEGVVEQVMAEERREEGEGDEIPPIHRFEADECRVPNEQHETENERGDEIDAERVVVRLHLGPNVLTDEPVAGDQQGGEKREQIPVERVATDLDITGRDEHAAEDGDERKRQTFSGRMFFKEQGVPDEDENRARCHEQRRTRDGRVVER